LFLAAEFQSLAAIATERDDGEGYASRDEMAEQT
jgi:hypothetical protein